MAMPPLHTDAIHLGRSAADKTDAIEQAGRALIDLGAVDEAYVAAMHEREASISTYIGEGVAIPHGTDASRAHVAHTALSFIQFPEGVDWGGPTVTIVVGIASQGNEHVATLSALAQILATPEKAESLRTASTPEAVRALLKPDAATDES